LKRRVLRNVISLKRELAGDVKKRRRGRAAAEEKVKG
jgi:hypothetical protein